MNISLPKSIFDLRGQVVKAFEYQQSANRIVLSCRRDRRYRVIDPKTGQSGTVNRYVRRQVKGPPYWATIA